jgi:hypothetical protein
LVPTLTCPRRPAALDAQTASRPAAGGCTCDDARPADTWAAATRRHPSTRRRTGAVPVIRWCSRTSPTRTGSGTSTPSRCRLARDSRLQSTIRRNRVFPDQWAGCRQTGLSCFIEATLPGRLARTTTSGVTRRGSGPRQGTHARPQWNVTSTRGCWYFEDCQVAAPRLSEAGFAGSRTRPAAG